MFLLLLSIYVFFYIIHPYRCPHAIPLQVVFRSLHIFLMYPYYDSLAHTTVTM